MSGTVSFGAVVAMLAATVGLAKMNEARYSERPVAPLASMSNNVGKWTTVTELALGDDIVSVLRPTDYVSRVYGNGSGPLIGLLMVYYADQRAGESMHSPKNCIPGSGWEVWESSVVPISTPAGQVQIARYGVQNGLRRMQVLYWYQTKNRLFSNEYLGKLYLMHDAIVDHTRSGALVRITLPDSPGALPAGIEFATEVIPEVRRILLDSR